MNKIIRIISFVVLITGLLYAGYKLLIEKEKTEETEIIKAQKKEDDSKQKVKEALLPVKVLKVERGTLPLRLRISATADVWEKSIIKAEVNGKVAEIKQPVGEYVSKGQLLVKLEDEDVKLRLEKAKTAKLKALSNFLVKENEDITNDFHLSSETGTDLNQLKESMLKAVKDYEAGKISAAKLEKIREEYDEKMVNSGALRVDIRKAQEGLSDAILSLKQAEIDLLRTYIRSPFPGMIAEILVSKGQRINAGQDVIKIVNLHSVYLKGFALESELNNLKKGTSVRIKFDAFPDRFFFGKIQAVSPEVDDQKKTITVYIEVDNKDKLILPGMHAEIDIEYKVQENVVKVPRKAIIIRQDRPLVFVIKDIEGTKGVADWRYVELGVKNDEEQEIISGVSAGEMVVVEGQLTLAHQSRVKITETLEK